MLDVEHSGWRVEMRYALTFFILGILVLSPYVASAAPEWSDGTPIVRFDERDNVSMVLVAGWRGLPERHWAGPAIWTNRLQDWTVRDGGLVCAPVGNAPFRTAHLLTYDLGNKLGAFHLEVVISMAESSEYAGFAGFLIGAGEGHLDYRGAALVHGLPGRRGGILAVVETGNDCALAFRDMSLENIRYSKPFVEQNTVMKSRIRPGYHRMVLNLESVPVSYSHHGLRLSVWDQQSGELLGAQEMEQIPASRLRGSVALVSHSYGRDVQHIFSQFKAGGGRLERHPERTFGPVAGTLYSVSGGTLKLAAQFTHLGEAIIAKGREKGLRLAARLEARPLGAEAGDWVVVDGPKAISIPDYHVLFRVEGWDASRNWETRVVFEDVRGETYTYITIVRREPVDRHVVSLAAFTGMGVIGRTVSQPGPKPGEGEVLVGRWMPANVWMPFAEAVQAVSKQNVDILFFTGDQIYEGKPSPADRSRMPIEDYLYKWLLWHWAFRELTNHIPAICQPDDHDVYHGNLWGWGGKLNLTNNVNEGGYRCSPYFVNMVHRTQTAHNPDAYDPGPLESGITNYYCGFTYGGIGFAVLEDRKFKTPPKITEPNQQILLGERQLQFLKEWGEDWTGQDFKVVVSQTGYASMHVAFTGELARDADSGGFPKVGRDRAVQLFRRCGALVICGDQHLSTMTRLGIEEPSDAVYQFCVPALANIFWRWFYPNTPGADRKPEEPEYLGEFADAWGNFLRMVAVANPERRELLGQKLRQRHVIPESEAKDGKGDSLRTCLGDGYGVVRFNKASQTVTIECWPHNADPDAGDEQFPGWPIILKLEELDGRRPVAWLPDLAIEGQDDPVVQIVDQASGEIVKVIRAGNGSYRPGVFDASKVYTLRVGEPGVSEAWWETRDLKPTAEPGEVSLKVMIKQY
jgi:alkaline phosphatase D